MSYQRLRRLLLSLFIAAAAMADPPGTQQHGLAHAPRAAVGNELGLLDVHAQTGWPAVHRDSRNSDFSPFVTPRSLRGRWRALDGAAVLPAPVMGPEGNLYVTTGRGPGTSHLHAFSQNGALLWESSPQNSPADLDSGASFSAPVVDRDGFVYLGDSNQIWSFTPAGAVRWVVPIPGGGLAFASLALTPQSLLAGATLDGKIVLLNREDGSLAAPAFDLPGGSGPPGAPVPPEAWLGLMDPAIIADAYHVFSGQVFEVTNTVAVHPETGRIYVPGAGATPDVGVLYGLDYAGGLISIAFQTPIGPGTGTSPAISVDGQRVYVADGNGLMSAFDGSSGALLWSAPNTHAFSSPTIGPDDAIYTGAAFSRPSRLSTAASSGHGITTSSQPRSCLSFRRVLRRSSRANQWRGRTASSPPRLRICGSR